MTTPFRLLSFQPAAAPAPEPAAPGASPAVLPAPTAAAPAAPAAPAVPGLASPVLGTDLLTASSESWGVLPPAVGVPPTVVTSGLSYEEALASLAPTTAVPVLGTAPPVPALPTPAAPPPVPVAPKQELLPVVDEPEPPAAPAPAPVAESARPSATSTAGAFLDKALTFQGQPYRWGGGHVGSTFSKPGPVDCSGLVQQAARMIGENLDGTAAMQQRMGRPVSMSDLKPGDLLFKNTPATHVGIYVGDGKFIHAPRTGDVVKVQSMASYSWSNARRVL